MGLYDFNAKSFLMAVRLPLRRGKIAQRSRDMPFQPKALQVLLGVALPTLLSPPAMAARECRSTIAQMTKDQRQQFIAETLRFFGEPKQEAAPTEGQVARFWRWERDGETVTLRQLRRDPNTVELGHCRIVPDRLRDPSPS